MSNTFPDRVKDLIKHPPNALRGNPFHFTNWVRFPALFDGASQVLHLNQIAAHYDLKPAEREGLQYWIRQAAIATCAAAQAYPRYFQRLEAHLNHRLAQIQSNMTQTQGQETNEDKQQTLEPHLQTLPIEKPRTPLRYYRDPERVAVSAA
jgi:hypothetical protein